MRMATGDRDAFLVMCDYFSTGAATKPFFRREDCKLVCILKQLSTRLVIRYIEGPLSIA